MQYYYEEYTVATTVAAILHRLVHRPQWQTDEDHRRRDVERAGQHQRRRQEHPAGAEPQGEYPGPTADLYHASASIPRSGTPPTTFDIKLPTYRTEELSTRVAVKSGETVVMGGVLEREKTTYVESVPVLGDIPILGALFRRRTEMDTPRYLLVFVTATIVKDTGEFLVYDDEHSATNSPAVTR